MKIFATGASGWLGSHVTPLLLKAGHQITAIARSDASAKKLQDQGVSVIRAGLEDTDALHKAAGEADAVIHMAYIHNFTDYGGNPAQTDYAAIRAMASALECTNKPILITSGIPVAPIHNIAETDVGTRGPRAEAENIAISYIDKGVRPIIIRLPFTVHGDGDYGFIPVAVSLALKTGVAAYIGDGTNTWPAVHVKDAAEVYKRAVENDKLPAGTRLHAVQDTGVPFKQIAEIIGKRTGAEVKSVPKEEASKYFEWLAMFVSMSVEPQTKLTKEWLGGWEPKEKTLLEDLETSPTYFAKKA